MMRTPLGGAARDRQSFQNGASRSLTEGRPTATAPFAKLPVALLNDENLDPIDVRVYGILRAVDFDNDGISLISLLRIGERVFRSERTAERSIRRLEKVGWIESLDNGIGLCKSYRLVTPAKHVGGGEALTAAVDDGGKARTPAIGDPQRLSSLTQTPVTGDQQPRRYLNSFPDGTQLTRKKTRDDARPDLLQLLAECQLDRETAEREADRLLRWFPHLEGHLVGHLRYAVSAKLDDPVEYAARQTQRGETPTPVADGRA
jgi:hypothetical protein